MADSIRLDLAQSPHGQSLAESDANASILRKREENTPGFVESFGIAKDLDWVSSNAGVAAANIKADYLTLPTNMSPDDLKAKWPELAKDHTPEEQDAILEHAGNWDAMVDSSRRIKERRANEEKLANAGWTGTGARILANLVDPTAIAATVASDGLAAPYLYADKLSKVARVARGAAYGAGTNVALEGVNYAAQDNYDKSNLLIALGTGGALGGLTGHLGHKAHPLVDEDAGLAKASANLAGEIKGSPFAHLKGKQAKFVQDIFPHAQQVAEELGIDPMLIVAQAAQETGWGKSARGNNLFGIKAGKGWTGKTQDFGTHEVINGQSVAMTDKFRAYDSVADSIKDHMNFLHTNKRYAEVLQHGNNPQEWFGALQRAGYATDPDYAKKLTSIYNQLGGKPGSLPDSVGAARNIHHSENVHPILEDDTAQFDKLVNTKAEFSSVNRFGTAAFLNADNPVMKWVGKNLLSDGVSGGNDAALHVDMLNHKFSSKWYKEHNSAFSEFKKSIRDEDMNNISDPTLWRRLTGQHEATVRKEFDIQIARAQRGITDGVSPQAKRMADLMGEQNIEMLRTLKAAGVAGVEEIQENAGYMVRQWKPSKFRELSQQFGDYQIGQLIKHAIKSKTPDIDDVLADKMGAAIYKRMRNKAASVGDDGAFHQPLFGKDNREALEEFMDMIDPHGEEVDVRKHMAEWFDSADAVKRDQSGTPSGNLKRRIDLDESFSVELTAKDGTTHKVSLSDLLENDATRLHTNYIRQMSGHAALAKMGIKGNKEWKTLMMHMERYGDQLGHKAEDIAKNKEQAEMVRNLLLGKPVSQWRATGKLGEFLQANRDIAYTRMMGQVGLASITELGSVISSVGLKSMFQHMPNFRLTITGMADGTIHPETPLFKELEDMFGAMGAGHVMNPPRLIENEVGDGAGRRAFNSFMTSTQAIKKHVTNVSGHNFVTSNLERAAFTGIAQKFLNTAYGAKWNPERLAYLGLDPKMTERVLSQMRTYATHETNSITGRKLLTIGHQNWDDIEALEAFQMATYREARRIVQQNLLGESPLFLSTDIGKTLLQFRSFQTAAWAKNTLHNVHMMDSETAANFGWSLFLGSIVYSLQTVGNAQGREDKAEFLKKHMDANSVGLGAFQKAGFSSIIPTVYDSVIPTITGGYLDAQFSHSRTSGQSANLFSLDGSPTMSNIKSAMQIPKAAIGVAVNPDYELSKTDIKNTLGLLAFQNAYGIRNLMNMLNADLPNQSQKQERD